MKRYLLSLAAVAAVCGAALAVGTVEYSARHDDKFSKLVIPWTSDVSGAVNEALPEQITGKIVRFATQPDGTDAPTNLFDVEFQSAEGVDMLRGFGADQSNAADAVVRSPTLGVLVREFPRLVVANAGATKKATAIIFLER